jgi:hypothetical protein
VPRDGTALTVGSIGGGMAPGQRGPAGRSTRCAERDIRAVCSVGPSNLRLARPGPGSVADETGNPRQATKGTAEPISDAEDGSAAFSLRSRTLPTARLPGSGRSDRRALPRRRTARTSAAGTSMDRESADPFPHPGQLRRPRGRQRTSYDLSETGDVTSPLAFGLAGCYGPKRTTSAPCERWPPAAFGRRPASPRSGPRN